MILPGFPVLLSKASGSSGFPAVTVGRANLGGMGIYGYIRPGGLVAGLYGASGGTLSATLVPGFVTDAVFDSTNDGIWVVVVGDCESVLSGVTALMDNGTPLPLLASAAYDSNGGVTLITFTGSWTSTGNRTVQLA